MSRRTRYFVARDEDGTVTELVRVISDEAALIAETYTEGQWVPAPERVGYLVEAPFDVQMVAEAEAIDILRDVGAQL